MDEENRLPMGEETHDDETGSLLAMQERYIAHGEPFGAGLGQSSGRSGAFNSSSSSRGHGSPSHRGCR